LAKDKAYERPLNMVTLRPEEITSGSEYVGVLFENGRGEGFSLGNRVDPSFLKEKHPLDSATILQVSASAIAGILYLLHHPREGLLFPEDVDENEVLPMIEQTLGGFVQEKKWHFFLFH
jgi:homospermidine synthase